MAQKKCQLCRKKVSEVDYRDTTTLTHYLTPWSKMKPSPTTGACSKHQRQISEAVKRARYMAMLPYIYR